MRNNKKGFTLTEILLAVMIVGIIGVALASLTTAASRESGVGRSKVLLRNNLSIVLRQLRRDIQESSRVMYVRGKQNASGTVPLLVLAKNVDQSGNAYGSSSAVYITYCFSVGNKSNTVSGSKVVPDGAKDGGTIYRLENGTNPMGGSDTPTCDTSNSQKILSNVKYIPTTAADYPVPLFTLRETTDTYSVNDKSSTDKIKLLRKNLGSALVVKLITELPSNPVVNDVTEETFILPNGFAVKQ